MFSERERLTAAAYIWHFVTGGKPATVTEACFEWDRWAKANVGITGRSRAWFYHTFLPKALNYGIMKQVEEQPKRYVLAQR